MGSKKTEYGTFSVSIQDGKIALHRNNRRLCSPLTPQEAWDLREYLQGFAKFILQTSSEPRTPCPECGGLATAIAFHENVWMCPECGHHWEGD